MSIERVPRLNRHRNTGPRLPMLRGAIALAILAAFSLSSCAAKNDDTATATASFTAMDTAMTVTVHAHDRNEADEALSSCTEIVRGLDEALSPTEDGSWIARLNDADEPLPAPDDVEKLIDRRGLRSHHLPAYERLGFHERQLPDTLGCRDRDGAHPRRLSLRGRRRCKRRSHAR